MTTKSRKAEPVELEATERDPTDPASGNDDDAFREAGIAVVDADELAGDVSRETLATVADDTRESSAELEAPAVCAVVGCPRAPVQSGLCGAHYATRRGERVRG